MKNIGLALSGGGFRATLYHLGLIRFLRDAGILSEVSHISSVSGGSILAAHLVLNWGRYNGSDNEFASAASEILNFVNLDIRNRIIRRFPLSIPLRWPRQLLGRSNRKLSRTGLLEYHYEQYLYGSTSLFELPAAPQLHILSTNLSEGCLCSFNRDSLLMMRRQSGNGYRIDRVHVGLATVAMAVTASSAFPGFFPPLELTGTDVGANDGEFGRQAYTDGAVFDNLGVRMFRCLERPLFAATPLSRHDFADFPATIDALRQATRSSTETPLHRLGQLLAPTSSRPDLLLIPNASGPSDSSAPSSGDGSGNLEERALARLQDVLRHHQFQHEPLFAELQPDDPEAKLLLHASCVQDKVLSHADQHWLNRHLLEAAFRQSTGRSCFRKLNSALDCVLVSDVGKAFEVKSNQRAGGLIHTGLRATDIVMDRVWQLEIETFHDVPGFVFAPVTDVVEPADDPTAVHPEIQRQLAHIRTDLDRFSPLEISALVRHGYCVGRKTCRAHPDLFGTKLPQNAPWDPVGGSNGSHAVSSAAGSKPLVDKRAGSEAVPAARDAKVLQASALRRVWSTLLDYRDWVSYVYVPIIIPLLFVLPYVVAKSYQRSHRISQLIDSLSQGSRDLEVMTRLLDGPMKPWPRTSAEEVPPPAEGVQDPASLDFAGFEVLQDSRIVDMRQWNPAVAAKNEQDHLVYGYRRLKVFKRPDNVKNNIFRITLLTTSPTAMVRCPSQRLQPKLSMSKAEGTVPGEKRCRWQISVDFSKVPAGEMVDVIYEHYSHGEFLQRAEGSTTLAFVVETNKSEVTRWFLMPEGKEYRKFGIIRYKTGKPQQAEPVQVVTEYLADDFSILAYKLMSVEAGYTYEVTWHYK